MIRNVRATSLDGLRRLRRIGGTLCVSYQKLHRVRGLDALVEIGGDVEVNCGGVYAPRLQKAMRRKLADVAVKVHVRYGISDDPRSPICRFPDI